MKRCWFGGGLLLFLLLSGLLMSRFISRFHLELGDTMVQAASLAGENRSEALAAVDRVREQWERLRWLTAVLSDHSPMEEIEEHLALLSPEEEDFHELCLRLASQFTSIGENQRLTLENLF